MGTYAKLLAGPAVAHITGLEIWEPYVSTYRLHACYDDIVAATPGPPSCPRWT